jgi:cobalt/nickel transport protein
MKHVPTRWVALGITVVALVLAGVVSFYASSSPDGLNRVARDEGFAGTEKDHHAGDGPLAGYTTNDVDDERLSGGLAGVIGVAVVLVLAGGLCFVVRRRNPADPDSTGPESDADRDHESV